jgi:hypothetical protein
MAQPGEHPVVEQLRDAIGAGYLSLHWHIISRRDTLQGGKRRGIARTVSAPRLSA